MIKAVLTAAILAAIPFAAHADDDAKAPADGSWSGSGEAGLAVSSGNTKSQNVNLKLQFSKEDETWKDNIYLNVQRAKSESNVATVQNGQIVNVSKYELTSNRYEAGVSAGYKLDERSYIVGAVRYEHDEFSSFDYQATVSLGYGYTAIKNAQTELSFEAGPGYKRSATRPYTVVDTTVPVLSLPATIVVPGTDGELIGRGLIAFKHKFTDTTAFENTFLVETGSNNTFLQNDAAVSVSMTDKLALKVGYQVRHNSDVNPGTDQTDQLLTTNLVYKF
ncbi:MAG: DUF481 domain-containing protein [Dokdonella sp.]